MTTIPTSPAKGFTSYTPASRWGEALISGNGVMGALVSRSLSGVGYRRL